MLKLILPLAVICLSSQSFAAKLVTNGVPGNKQVTQVNTSVTLGQRTLEVITAECSRVGAVCSYNVDCYIPLTLLKQMGIDSLSLMTKLTEKNDLQLFCYPGPDRIATSIQLTSGDVFPKE